MPVNAQVTSVAKVPPTEGSVLTLQYWFGTVHTFYIQRSCNAKLLSTYRPYDWIHVSKNVLYQKLFLHKNCAESKGLLRVDVL